MGPPPSPQTPLPTPFEVRERRGQGPRLSGKIPHQGIGGGVWGRGLGPPPLSPLPESFLLPQVGLDDPGVAPDIPGEAFGDDLALVQDHDPLAQAHDQGHIVFDDQQGDA